MVSIVGVFQHVAGLHDRWNLVAKAPEGTGSDFTGVSR